MRYTNQQLSTEICQSNASGRLPGIRYLRVPSVGPVQGLEICASSSTAGEQGTPSCCRGRLTGLIPEGARRRRSAADRPLAAICCSLLSFFLRLVSSLRERRAFRSVFIRSRLSCSDSILTAAGAARVSGNTRWYSSLAFRPY